MREVTEEMIAASKHMINGIPDEIIDTHMRNLINRLEAATKAFEKDQKEFYTIARLSKDDIRQAMRGGGDAELPPETEKRIEDLNELEMTKLAEKLSDDYCEQLFWFHLKIIFEDRVLNWS
jgi:hypothetical protein